MAFVIISSTCSQCCEYSSSCHTVRELSHSMTVLPYGMQCAHVCEADDVAETGVPRVEVSQRVALAAVDNSSTGSTQSTSASNVSTVRFYMHLSPF